jgi:hypothetical protein
MSAELARRIIDTWAAGGVEAIVPFIHAEFHGEVNAETSVEPDQYLGHDGVRRYFALWAEAMSELTLTLTEVEEFASGMALANLTIAGRGTGSGAPVEFHAWSVMEFRDGLLIYMESFGTREGAVEAAGG